MYDQKIKDRERADEKRRALAVYKVEKGCVDCGYNAHPSALEFDHLPEFTKARNIGGMLYHAWEAIWAEVAKCEVVCANCHAVRTFERRGY